MTKVRYHPEARAEFLHEVEYYAVIGTRLAELYATGFMRQKFWPPPTRKRGQDTDRKPAGSSIDDSSFRSFIYAAKKRSS